jgi:hypothetical protein
MSAAAARPGAFIPVGALVLTAALAVAACAGPLRFRPEWPSDLGVGADYRVKGSDLLVEIETAGYRLEEAVIVVAGGDPVPARRIVPPEARGGSGLTVGVGVGGSGNVGSVGVGAGVGIPVWGGRPTSHSLAEFPLDRIGPAPWRLQVKLVGHQPVVIVLRPAS